MESPWGGTSVFPGGGGYRALPNPMCPLPTGTGKTNVTTYRFQEGDAADGTSCEPSGPCRNIRQFPSSETQRNTIKTGTTRAQNEKERNTLPQDYPHRLCVPSPSSRRQLGAKRR